MKNKWFLLAVAVFPVFFSGCGLSIYEDWKKSGGKAIAGAGAIAGKDYVTGLTPSENSRKYFARISGDNRPIETVSRSDEGESKSGVKFVKNGGILIPPGVTISFENKGYCMDPNLPAPKAGEEYQLIPMTQLIPEDLQGIYKNLVTKAAAGDESVQRNMQHLVWALRTAGTDAAFANNLTKEQKRILDRCSDYPGQFEEFNANAKANSKALKELIGLADSFLNVKIGGVTYKASDLLDPDVGNKKINEHLNQLIGMSKNLPVEKTGFNFGEIQPGIYTDVQGTGYLQYKAKIANTTNQPFIYYPSEYVGQVGSPTKSSGMTFFAAADSTMRQRVTGGNPSRVEAQGEENNDEAKCKDFHKRKAEAEKFYREQIENAKKNKARDVTIVVTTMIVRDASLLAIDKLFPGAGKLAGAIGSVARGIDTGTTISLIGEANLKIMKDSLPPVMLNMLGNLLQVASFANELKTYLDRLDRKYAAAIDEGVLHDLSAITCDVCKKP